VSALTWAAIAVLGALGALLRALVDLGVARVWPSLPTSPTGLLAGVAGFPLGIVIVNASGALVAGLLVGAGLVADSGAGLLVISAFLGGYTTFSTWMLDVVVLWGSGRRVHAATNLVGSVVAGLALGGVGYAIASALP